MANLQTYGFDWPAAAALATDADAETTAAVLKQKHRDAWRQHPSLIRFLEDHYPQVWSRNVIKLPDGTFTGEGVAWCRTRHLVQPRREDGAELVRLVACGERPFCPACNDASARRRGGRILRKIVAATPPDEDVTAYLVTMGVSEQDDARTGRVALVTREWKRFKHAIHDALRDAYGEHAGAFTTYQDYGQSTLVKQRPHVHALVHNFQPVSEKKYRRTRKFAMHPGGAIRQALRDLDIDLMLVGWRDALSLDRLARGTLRPILQNPVCDVAMLRLGSARPYFARNELDVDITPLALGIAANYARAHAAPLAIYDAIGGGAPPRLLPFARRSLIYRVLQERAPGLTHDVFIDERPRPLADTLAHLAPFDLAVLPAQWDPNLRGVALRGLAASDQGSVLLLALRT